MSTRDTGAELLNQVDQALARYVILPSPEAATAVALWIGATHAAPAWNTAARLVIRAPEKRCGKSRLLDIIEAICHRPVMTVNASPSAIYRLIGSAQGDPPTVLIDEADTIFGHDAGAHEDLRGLLNAGHQRGRPALRWDVNSRTVEELDTYAMAALAGIGRLPDTIEDRAVVIKMRRRAPNETVQPYRLRRDAPPLNQLRVQLHRWTLKHIKTLTSAVPVMPLEDRAADTWEALIAIADHAGGDWGERARHAAVVLTNDAQQSDDETLATELLKDCKAAFAGRDIIRTQELLTTLKSDLEAPWVNHGAQGLTPRALATKLKEFGIVSRVLRFDGTQQRGYASNDFTDAWDRYLPPIPEIAVTSVMASQPQVRPCGERDGKAKSDGSEAHSFDLLATGTNHEATTQRETNVVPIRHNPDSSVTPSTLSPGDVTE